MSPSGGEARGRGPTSVSGRATAFGGRAAGVPNLHLWRKGEASEGLDPQRWRMARAKLQGCRRRRLPARVSAPGGVAAGQVGILAPRKAPQAAQPGKEPQATQGEAVYWSQVQ
jgi:hypothetical protein